MRAVHRPVRRQRTGLVWRGACAIACTLAVAGAEPASTQSAQPPKAPPGQSLQRPPVFRGGAVFVRLDVYATKGGRPVTDVTAEDIEVLEDGTRQSISTFEHVLISAGNSPSSRVEPRTEREMREMAADSRARLFLAFLDKPHLRMSSGFRITRPLGNLLRRLMSTDDMVGMMTPEMSALDVRFTRGRDRLAAWLQTVNAWEIGTSGRVISDDPVEDDYRGCFPSVYPTETSPTAQEMIDRRREQRTLDALTDLVRYVDGLREERKAILLISEGYRLFTPNPELVRAATSRTYSDGTTRRVTPWCLAELQKLAELDHQRSFHELMADANKANASFYPVDPRGLAVFDSDMGPAAPPPVDVDIRQAHGRQESLELAASLTDGLAILTNDIDAGLQRVIADLSSYYLIGYASTNTKLDGRFRRVTVRSVRPEIDIRARRGYRVPTAGEVSAGAAPEAPLMVDAATAAVEDAVASLAGFRSDAPFQWRVSAGWWTPPGRKPAGAEPALWIYGNVDVKRPGGDNWSQGGRAEVAIVSDEGVEVTSFSVPVVGATGAFVTRFPRNGEDAWLDPGNYAVRVRVRPATGGLPTMDTMRFELPEPAGAGSLLLGAPVCMRRGQATGNKEVVTADRQFRRSERMTVDISSTVTPESVSGVLLDRAGKVLAIPVTATLMEQDGVVWVRGELVLSSLAAGDYVVRMAASRGSETRQMLAPFRIIS